VNSSETCTNMHWIKALQVQPQLTSLLAIFAINGTIYTSISAV